MTTYGLRIINDDSELLIDSNYFSPAFSQKLELNTTYISQEAGTSYIHSGYVKREYRTNNVTVPGNYIVMWSLPDNTTKDIWYGFESSTVSLGGYLTAWVYANSMGEALTYTLPTAYIFAVGSLPDSTGPALRMYNSNNVKTFDSNNVQLVPYSISDEFTFWDDAAGTLRLPTTISLSIPTNPIYMLPMYSSFRVYKASSTRRLEWIYEAMFKRVGDTITTSEVPVYYAAYNVGWTSTQTIYNRGNRQGLAIIVADGDLYQTSTAGTGTGTNPTYTLTSSNSIVNEGATVTITLNTTNVANGALFGYTVTGITGADLSSGSLTGIFNIQTGTASASFTFTNDYSTEGEEVFRLSLDNLSNYVNITVTDTSLTPSYSWSVPNNVNEGAQSFTTFNATNAIAKVISFALIAPTTGTTTIAGDCSLDTTSWTVGVNTATSTNVYYSASADFLTEGAEAFRLAATVDGVTYYSANITVNDTSLTAAYSITASASWNESATVVVTVAADNVSGTTLYLTTSNVLIVPSSASVAVSGASYSTNINYTAGIVTADTSVTIYVRTGSATGTIVASKVITVVQVASIYSFDTVTAFDEGTTSSIVFNFNYAASKHIAFSIVAPTTGLNGSGDVTLLSTALDVPADNNAAGWTGVSYSVAADNLTEGTEYFRIGATVDSVTYYSGNIPINDTSVTPSYSLTRSVASVNEGGSFTITFATNQTGSFGYTITGVTSADINGASLTGTISNGTVLTFSPTSDTTTEGAETFSIALNNGLASTTVLINDTSLTPATYSLTRSVASVNEGGSFTVTFATNQTGSFGYTITGVTSADINGASLTGTVANGNVLTFSSTSDTTTEGAETFSIALNNGLASTTVLINDTSVTPSYSFTRSVASVNEGGSFTITFATNQVGNFPYTISGVSYQDLGLLYLTGTISNGTVLTFSPTSDTTTEGAETFTIALDNGLASTTVLINDTSLTPATYSLTRSVASVNEGGSFTVTFATNQAGSFGYTITGVTSTDINGASLTGTVANGTVLTYNILVDNLTEGAETFSIALNNGLASTSVTFNDTSVTPSYSLTRSVASVNEGGSFTVTFATNQTGSNFSYTITGVASADIGGASLTGFIINGDVLTFSSTSDTTTEGAETFTITLENGLASTTVLINDTSLTPATYSFTRSVASVNEGDWFDITLNSNQAGPFAYTITGVTSTDINGASLTGSISPGAGSKISFLAKADTTTEGTETFTITLNNGLASTSVTFNDTSLTPAIARSWYTFTTIGSQTWTVPAGITSIKLAMVGGGAGGRSGAGSTSSGGGGGAGAVLYFPTYAVTPGSVLTIVVGAGGARAAAGSDTTISGTGSTTQTAGGGLVGTANQLGGSSGIQQNGSRWPGGTGTIGGMPYNSAAGGGGGSTSNGGPGAIGEGGDGGQPTDITTDALYTVAAGGSGGGVAVGGSQMPSMAGYLSGGGAGGSGGGAGGNATYFGCGGGGGANPSGLGGTGYKGIVQIYG